MLILYNHVNPLIIKIIVQTICHALLCVSTAVRLYRGCHPEGTEGPSSDILPRRAVGGEVLRFLLPYCRRYAPVCAMISRFNVFFYE